MTHAEMMARMMARELRMWEQLHRLEPFGDERADLRQALATCWQVNSSGWGGGTREPSAYKLKFDHRRRGKRQRDKDIEQHLRGMVTDGS